MQEFRFAVEYRGGQFVKTVYAVDAEAATRAIDERYAGSEFKVLYRYPTES